MAKKNDTVLHIQFYPNNNEMYLGSAHNSCCILTNSISHYIEIDVEGKEKGLDTDIDISTNVMLSKENIKALHKYIHRLEKNVQG